LEETVPKALWNVSLMSVRRFHRKSYRYMHAYMVGLTPRQAEFAVKKLQLFRWKKEVQLGKSTLSG
jgi:hypothetical protein